jgi:WhiB family transcriptional regulator, redox-sensing transcriptional regulator
MTHGFEFIDERERPYPAAYRVTRIAFIAARGTRLARRPRYSPQWCRKRAGRVSLDTSSFSASGRTPERGPSPLVGDGLRAYRRYMRRGRPWQLEAKCGEFRDYRDWWFPQPGERADRAREVCAVCPVRDACLKDAIDANITDGMWGGRTPSERQKLRRTAS